MNSVQKSSQIKNVCTEFLHFARSAKITAFYMSKSPVFVFFWQNMAFLIQTELPEWSMATLRYEPCIQFINVSQRALHIYWQPSAMSLAIHKIASKRRCQSYFISRRSPHHGKSKNRDLWASSQSRFLFCLCAAHCSRKLSIYLSCAPVHVVKFWQLRKIWNN